MIADALFEDPRDIAHEGDTTDTKLINAAHSLYNDMKSHSYVMFSIETGDVKDWDPKVTKNMSPADAEKVLREYAERDKIPHVTAFLGLVPQIPKRNDTSLAF